MINTQVVSFSHYLIYMGDFARFFSKNLVSFVNSTHLRCFIFMSQTLGALHTLWYCLHIRFPRIPSFGALSGYVLHVSIFHFNGYELVS